MLIQADARKIPLADESVHCVVTSPPYWGLRDYGQDGQLGLESTPEQYVSEMVEVFREVRRVLRKDGTVWLNLGDSYNGGGGYSPDAPSNQGGNFNQHAKVFESSKRKGVGSLKPKDLVGIPWRVAFALQADGWYLRSDIIWSKPNPMPESVTDRPTKAHEYVFLLSKEGRYYFDQDAVREKWADERQGCPGSPSPKELTIPGQAPHTLGSIAWESSAAGRNIRTVWTIATQPWAKAHYATFPEALVKRCVLAGCPGGGTVLDPFVGSGTTVRVARSLGRKGIGLDLNFEYLSEQARERIRVTQGRPLC